MDVFDRVYVDCERFDQMTYNWYFFVTCLLKNVVIGYLETFALTEDSSVLSGEMIVIGITHNRSENVFRLIKVLDSKENKLQLLTNRFDLSADEIVQI